MNLTYDYTMFKETFESEFTWLNGFMRNVNRFGERDALYDPAGNRKWTYDKLNKDSNKLANKMKKDGVSFSMGKAPAKPHPFPHRQS